MGTLLHRLRSVRGLTQSQVSQASGVALATLSRMESDAPDRRWRPDTIRRVVRVLHAVTPLSDDDTHALEAIAGIRLSALISVVGEHSGARILLSQVTRDHVRTGDGPAMDRVRGAVDELVRRVGPARAADAIQTLVTLSAPGIPPALAPALTPAPIRPAPPIPGPQRVVQQSIEEGHLVTEIAPIQHRYGPPNKDGKGKASPARATSRRKSGA